MFKSLSAIGLVRPLSVAALAAYAMGAVAAQANVIVVSAKDDIFLAGLAAAPTGMVGSYFPNQTGGVFGNTNPGAGLLPYVLSFTGGSVTLSAVAVTTGTGTSCGSGCAVNDHGAVGNSNYSSPTTVVDGPYSVTSYTGYTLGLVGAWGKSGTPPTVDPSPQTAFLIGAGGTFLAPAGDNILFLGTVDAFGGSKYAGTYNDNQGGFDVAVSIPEPASWALMGIGFAGLGFTAYRRTRTPAAL